MGEGKRHFRIVHAITLLCLMFSASLLQLFRSNLWWAGGHLRLFHIPVLCVLLHRICSNQIFVPDLFWIPVLPVTNNQPKTSNEFYLFYCSDQILRVACFWGHYLYASYQNQTFVEQAVHLLYHFLLQSYVGIILAEVAILFLLSA